jgi:hypothetical protein
MALGAAQCFHAQISVYVRATEVQIIVYWACSAAHLIHVQKQLMLNKHARLALCARGTP